MRLKEYDIVIEPREVVFEHITGDKLFTKTLNIKNVGNKSKRMELFRPSNKAFKLIVKNPQLPVPPGMEIAALIEFQTNTVTDYTDKLVVSIDDREVDIPLHAFPAKPILRTTDIVNFGVQAANNKTISSSIKILNTGALDGDFVFSYKGEHTITFTPSKGSVPPYSAVDVRVDFFTKVATEIDEKINVIFQGSEKPHILNVKALVMKRSLELVSPGAESKVDRIDFGSCYYGCNLTNLSILFNNSPEPVKYAMVLEEKGIGSEIGAELSKSTKALRAQVQDYNEDDFCPLDKLVSAFPNNGTLQPFEKRPVFFRFTPQYNNPKTGFQCTLKPPPRRDYAVFLYFEGLGTHERTEVAITGTALPILLKAEPNELDFGSCPIGQKVEIETVLSNESELKDIRFKFDKVANFTVYPACGRIGPRSKRKILVSFIPHQVGKFTYTLNCNVTDKAADEDNPLVFHDRSILDLPIKLVAEALSLNIIPVPKHSGGFMPLITNEVGLNVNTTVSSLKPFMPKTAVQNAANDKLHRNAYSERVKPGKESDYKVAYPNDRAKSIAPFSRTEKYKTLFTQVDRYNYIDPDYAYTDEERLRIEKHKIIYRDYIRELKYLREEKLRTKEHFKNNNEKDIGLVPGCGIKPQHLTLKELEEEAAKNAGFYVAKNWKLLNSEELLNEEIKLKSSSPKEGLPSVMNGKMNQQLSPADLYKIVVTPSVIDFGEVVIKSSAVKHLDFLNTLEEPIFVDLETDCIELRQSSPLAQVIPPKSKGTFPIVFESTNLQSFQRSITYRINNFYRHHVIVLAETKLPSLLLSTNHVVLNQLTGVSPELSYRTSVTIRNPYNATTEFTWMPIYGEQGTAFSIRPATGTIEPFKELDCEIVWHGSFLAPLTGTFSLLVQGGDPLKLTCEAKLGTPQVQFINRRANFGKIPLNASTTRTFYISNQGVVHSYFQVLDNEPIPGMTVSPRFGVVPVGGTAPIKVQMNPSDVIKFDARVLVQVRGSKRLELRLGGESEEPYVDISVPKFDFGGIFSGASCGLPFTLMNKSKVRATVEFDLIRYSDFSLRVHESDSEKHGKQLKVSNHVYEVVIEGEQIIKMDLVFSPTEVAAYEFELPVVINKPPKALYEESKTITTDVKFYELITGIAGRDNKTPATPKSNKQLTNYVPIRHVTAIALRYGLHLSTTKIHFEIPLLYLERLQHGGFYEAKSILMTNHGHRKIKWCLDMRKSNIVLENGIFKFCHGSMAPFVTSDPNSIGPEGELLPSESFQIMVLFCPDKPGKYECKIPIIVNDNFEQPYYSIHVTGELLTPTVLFEPNLLVLKPIPLGLPRTEKIVVRPLGYELKSSLSVDIPEAETLDGEKMQVLSVEFLTDTTILPNNQSQPKEVSITFECTKPISTTIQLIFKDEQNHTYPYNVVVTADNSLFTCYGFLADHQSEYHIVLEEGKVMKGSRYVLPSRQSGVSGEPILRPYTGNSHLSRTRTASPTFDMMSSYGPTPVHHNEMTEMGYTMSASNSKKNTDRNLATPLSRTQESVMFPSSESEAGIFSVETLKGLQRWFSCNGWPTSYNPVRIPESFRGGISRKPLDDNNEKLPQQDAMKSDIKTFYDMITYLCGKPLPGIPIAAPVPNDISDRTKQFYWQHNVLLTFLRTQGGCVSFIKPEYLLDLNEFKCHLAENQTFDSKLFDGFKEAILKAADSADVTLDSFESVSKKAWLDCLLQILKTLVINRITPKSFKNLPLPDGMNEPLPMIKPDPLISNIYSVGERILLTWINHCYSHYKDKIWGSDSPPARWIVNFDIDITDSLALAATFGAYCPFLIDTHLKRMYVQANTAEKCFHNALILADCCKHIGLDYDLNALDITDPNPIALCLFCSQLYDVLPNYLPKSTIDFTGALNQTVSKQVKVSNPSPKSILYHAKIIGPNAEHFTLPKGYQIPLGAKAKFSLPISFQGKNLKPGNAYLILVSKKQETMIATTLCFFLKTNIDELTAKKLLRYQSPLYKVNDIIIDVENPYEESADFKVTVIESNNKTGVIKNPFNEKDTDVPRVSVGEQPLLSAFHTKITNIKIDGRSKSPLPVTYLPLQLTKHSAVIIFSNDKVGEFIYYLEGTALLPQPFKVVVDESALDSHRCKLIKSNRGDDVNGLAFRCFAGDYVELKLQIPVYNYQREQALMQATQIRMSPEEVRRRNVHNILSSKSLLEAIDKLTINKEAVVQRNVRSLTESSKRTKSESEVVFNVDSSNTTLFQMPTTVMITQDDAKSDENMLPFTVRFSSEKQGVFSTLVQLQSPPDDIRLIPIEIKVTDKLVTDSSVACLEFSACVFDSIVQPIPIKNASDNPCHYEAEIDVKGRDRNVFNGLRKFTVQPKQTFVYELKFEPRAENMFEGELKLNNVTEGLKTKYLLNGKGEKAPPITDINIETRVGEIVEHQIMIPNRGNKKICFYVKSNLPFIRGPEKLLLLPNRKEPYKFEICAPQRGEYKGIVTFKPGEWPIKDIDSDGEEIVTIDAEDAPQNFTLWFSLDLKVHPPPPQTTVNIETNCLDTCSISVPLSNPFEKEIELQTFIDGSYLEGDSTIRIKPKTKAKYELKFSPKRVGTFKGSLRFLSDETGEFWYDIRMTSLDPSTVTLPTIQCEVGRYIRDTIKLQNPLAEQITFQAYLSNTNNFSLELNQSEQIVVEPNSSTEVPFIFTPSTVGRGDHFTEVIFNNEKVGLIKYQITGMGLQPTLQEFINISAEVGNSELCSISFKNSTDSAIYCDFLLYDGNPNERGHIDSLKQLESDKTFNILLDVTENVRVAPKGTLDIPVVFCPEELKQYKSTLVVTARREARMSWRDNNEEVLSELKWIYPIRGIAAIYPIKNKVPLSIECMVRNRVEKRLELFLSDIDLAPANADRATKVRSVTPQESKPKIPDGVIVGEGRHIEREFLYTVIFKNNSTEYNNIFRNSLGLKLVRYHRDRLTGLITLIFDAVFSPSKPFVTDAYIQIETASGGTWRYPLKLAAIEPPPDDTIVVEAAGLNQESIVGFRLSSKSNNPVPFTAQFFPTGDQVFSVFPSSGELLPDSANGSLIKVTFTPPAYGKTYQNTLVVTTNDYQWKYIVRGVTPEYVKPKGVPMAGSYLDPKLRRVAKNKNYVLDNTNLHSTATSSPHKGKPLVSMKYYCPP